MKVIHENVLLELPEKTQEKELGVVITETETDERTGIIIDMGKEVNYSSVKIGDKVKFKEFFSGERFEKDGKKYIVIHFTDILFVY